MVLKLFLFVPCILNGVYIVMYVMFSEAPIPQYLNWLTVVLHCVNGFCMCVSLGGTPFVLLVIMVLCIVISFVLWKMHSLIYKVVQI